MGFLDDFSKKASAAGKKAIAREAVDVTTEKKCPSCGQTIENGAAFCMNCGAKLEEN